MSSWLDGLTTSGHLSEKLFVNLHHRRAVGVGAEPIAYSCARPRAHPRAQRGIVADARERCTERWSVSGFDEKPGIAVGDGFRNSCDPRRDDRTARAHRKQERER